MSTVQVEIDRAGQVPTTVEEPVGVAYEYPGIPTTCEGAEAVVHVEVHVSQAVSASPAWYILRTAQAASDAGLRCYNSGRPGLVMPQVQLVRH